VFLSIGCIALFIFYVALLRYGFFWEKSKQNKGSLFACPVAKEYCQKIEAVTFLDGSTGLGFYAPAGTSIYAVADGLVTQAVIDLGEKGGRIKLLTLTLDNEDHFLYNLKGSSSLQGRRVTRGEEIGKIEEGIKMFKDAGLVISLNRAQKSLPIKVKDFE